MGSGGSAHSPRGAGRGGEPAPDPAAMLVVKFLARHPHVLSGEDARFPIRWPDGLGARLRGLLPADAARTPPAELAARLRATPELWEALREARPLLAEHAGVLFELAAHSRAEDAQFAAWPSDYAAHYEVTRERWGEGSFGTVYKCVSRATGTEYACKKIAKRAVGAGREQQRARVRMLKNEVWTMLTVCKHPQIADLVAVFETDAELVLIEEPCVHLRLTVTVTTTTSCCCCCCCCCC